jgi:hypothetical protein
VCILLSFKLGTHKEGPTGDTPRVLRVVVVLVGKKADAIISVGAMSLQSSFVNNNVARCCWFVVVGVFVPYYNRCLFCEAVL